MRVLHLHSGNMYGGVETLLVTLAREAAAAPGMSHDIALCFPGRLSGELEAVGRPAFGLPPVRLSRPHSLIKARLALRRLLCEQAFDAVICHQPWACVAFGPAVRAAGFPLVLWVHQPVEGGALLDRLARRTRPDLAICNSRYTESRVRGWLSSVDTAVVYGPVAPPVRATVAGDRVHYRRLLATPDGDVVMMTACRMEAWKGHRVLLAALERLRATPGWTCWIVGGSQNDEELGYERELRHAARVFGLEARIRFTGQRSDVAALLAAADVYCQANTAPEAFGVSFVEALYAGLPIVTSAMGGALEIVDPDCGFLLPPADAEALSDALRLLIADDTLRARMSSAARCRPSAFCDVRIQLRGLQQALIASASASELPATALAG